MFERGPRAQPLRYFQKVNQACFRDSFYMFATIQEDVSARRVWLSLCHSETRMLSSQDNVNVLTLFLILRLYFACDLYNIIKILINYHIMINRIRIRLE